MVFTGLEYRVNDQSFLVEEPLSKPENTDKALLNPYSREIYLHKIEFKLLLHCVITRKVQNWCENKPAQIKQKLWYRIYLDLVF